MADKNKRITLRLDDELSDLIEQYIILTSKKKSKALRDIIYDGLYRQSRFILEQRFNEYLNKRDPFKFMTECEKCGGHEDLMCYFIDGDINNRTMNNMITLCRICVLKFEVVKIRRESYKEKLIEWWFS